MEILLQMIHRFLYLEINEIAIWKKTLYKQDQAPLIYKINNRGDFLYFYLFFNM